VQQVNGIAYHRAGLLGKGGSSRVYRVLDASNNLFAIKRVDIGRNDAETRASFLNEIQLLEKLKGKPQIIRLIDSEMNEAKKTLMMVRIFAPPLSAISSISDSWNNLDDFIGNGGRRNRSQWAASRSFR
jgi:serine/threonine protein kinase